MTFKIFINIFLNIYFFDYNFFYDRIQPLINKNHIRIIKNIVATTSVTYYYTNYLFFYSCLVVFASSLSFDDLPEVPNYHLLFVDASY